MLKEAFIELLTKYLNNKNLMLELWSEIEKNYSDKKRHYHTLQHLDNLLIQLTEVKNKIQSWETVLFSLYYHDIIYNALKADNEEKSANLAEKRMKAASVPGDLIANCIKQILATKSHMADADPDTNYFTDADLSILGQPWEIYSTYYQDVRKEYAILPDFIYNPGRKKVLNRFLEMDRIFKTNYFYNKFNQQAKRNLQKELEDL